MDAVEVVFDSLVDTIVDVYVLLIVVVVLRFDMSLTQRQIRSTLKYAEDSAVVTVFVAVDK